MAGRIQRFDWVGTSLGPIETWSERLKGAVEHVLASPLVSSLAHGPRRILIYNDAAARLYGDRHPGALGQPLQESFPDSFPAVALLYERVFDGETSAVPAQPLDVSGAGGEVFEAYLVDLRRMQERQSVLVAELQHRTRNLITVVKGISQQTLRRSTGLDVYREQFTDRLEALSRVQGLLSRAEVEPITIDALVRMELDALGFDGSADGVTIDGPEVFLPSSVVQILALALHELATNAHKHGVLAADRGRLQIQWEVWDNGSRARHLCLEWIEDGISQRHAAQRQIGGGYGRELIERALPYQLDATTSYQLTDKGLRCTIELPLKRRDERI